MVHTLTEEEVIKYRKDSLEKFNTWFTTLSFGEKEMLYKQYEPIFEQIKCKHEVMFSTAYYNGSVKYCKHCDYTITEREPHLPSQEKQ